LFEYSADMVTSSYSYCALGPAAWCSGRLRSRQFTLNMSKGLAKRLSKKISYHGRLSTMAS